MQKHNCANFIGRFINRKYDERMANTKMGVLDGLHVKSMKICIYYIYTIRLLRVPWL